MERIDVRDLTLKLFGIADNAFDEGFNERRVKLDSLRLLKQYRGQDNYKDLMSITVTFLATREIRLTAEEQRELLGKDNPEYSL